MPDIDRDKDIYAFVFTKNRYKKDLFIYLCFFLGILIIRTTLFFIFGTDFVFHGANFILGNIQSLAVGATIVEACVYVKSIKIAQRAADTGEIEIVADKVHD